jgi:predicted esterase
VSRQEASGRAGQRAASDIMTAIMTTDPHRGQPILHRGPEPAAARLTVVCVHGRGASASDILSLADELGLPDVAYVAPEAAGHTWYPRSFLAPIEDNQPFLDSALGVLATLVDELRGQEIPSERIGLLGFSQGACLSLEFAARHAQRYAAIVAFSGGVIGPPGTRRMYPRSMVGTPVFLGCSDVDPHIPLERVQESADVFRALGATVDQRIYPRMAHAINADELKAAQALLSARPPRRRTPPAHD